MYKVKINLGPTEELADVLTLHPSIKLRWYDIDVRCKPYQSLHSKVHVFPMCHCRAKRYRWL